MCVCEREREREGKVSECVSSSLDKCWNPLYINGFAPRDFPVPTKYVKKNTLERNTHANKHSLAP